WQMGWLLPHTLLRANLGGHRTSFTQTTRKAFGNNTDTHTHRKQTLKDCSRKLCNFHEVEADCNGSELEEGEERALMLEDAASIQSFVGRVSKDYQVANWQYQSLLQAHT
ncbi:hypothetical protein KUCAC02_012539, partial [Chaenocephalus aceratus]